MGSIPQTVPWTPEQLKSFWDFEAKVRSKSYFSLYNGKALASIAARNARSRKNVVDLGCGVGYLLPHLARRFDEVYGAEIDGEALESARARVADVPKVKGFFILLFE